MRLRATHPATVTPRKIQIDTGCPMISPVPNHRTRSEPMRLMGRLSLICRARPRAMASMASVATKGVTRPNAMAVAFTVPSSSAKPRAPKMNAHAPESINSPPATPAAATIDPTDRSMPDVAITKVIPIASTPTTLAWVSMARTLSVVRNVSGFRMVPTTSSTTMTTTSVYSCSRIVDGRANRPHRPSAVAASVVLVAIRLPPLLRRIRARPPSPSAACPAWRGAAPRARWPRRRRARRPARPRA